MRSLRGLGHSARRHVFALALIAATLSSGPGYWLQVGLAGRATDFTRDFVAASWLARGKPLSQLDGVTGNREAVRLGAEPVLLPCGPFHLHPPPASLPVLALVPFGFRGAALVWMLLSLVAAGWLARSLNHVLAPTKSRAIVLLVAICAWPPTVMNLAFGQWSLVLAALVAAGYVYIETERPRAAGMLLALAISFKTTPAVLLGHLALARRRTLWIVVAGVVALAAVSWPLTGGLDAWRTFLRDGPPDVVCWEAYVDNTNSVNGVLARALVGGRYVQSWFHLPLLAHRLGTATSVAMVALAAFATRATLRSRNVATSFERTRAQRPAFAAWASLVALLNPLSWTHNALFFLLPAALLFSACASEDVESDRRADAKPIRWIVAIALVLLSLPRETLFRWAGPLPFSPAGGTLLGIHALGGFAIYACSIWLSLEQRYTRAPASASSARHSEPLD